MFKYLYLTFCLMFCILGLQAEKIRYDLPDDPIDVVIVSHPKDQLTLDDCIEGIKTNCSRVRRVIVVSPIKLTDNAEFFDEKLFPFSKQDIALTIARNDPDLIEKIFDDRHSPGWYYQQLLKLYASFMIPGLSSNVLIIDADVIFMNPVEFLNEAHGGLFCFKKKDGKFNYFQHAKRLVPGYKRVHVGLYSVCHHMLFQRPILQDLFRIVEEYHQMEFWKAFCRCVDFLHNGGASEYEIYFNFAMNHTKQVALRPLKWTNSALLDQKDKFKKAGYHYVAFHTYLRDRQMKHKKR